MIEVKNLWKKYGEHTALADLSFQVKEGQIYGFLGPNGAGKSTTMNIMTGCLAATSGDVLIDGHDIFEEAAAAKKLIGYLPEQPPLYPDMTPLEFLRFVAKAKKIPQEQRPEQLQYVINITRIAEVQNRLIKNLSKGYRQRVGIAQALLGDPPIIILDEPTVGLDPKQIIEIRDLIRSLKEKHTVILSSHILSEVRAICDVIMIISRGRLAAIDTPANLEKLFAGSTTIELLVRAGEEETRRALAYINGIDEIVYEPQDEKGLGKVLIQTSGTWDLREEIFFAFCNIQKPLLGMQQIKADLEDVFLELTAEQQEEREVQQQ